MQEVCELQLASFAKHAIGRHTKKALSFLKRSISRRTRNVEAIHQLRTETRRADAAIRLLAAFLPHRRTEKIRHRLKRLRAKAGKVRDLDVLREQVKSLDHQLPKQAADWLADRAKSKRSTAMRSLQQHGRKQLDHDWKVDVTRLWGGIPKRADGDHSLAVEQAVRDLAANLFQAADRLRTDSLQMHPTRILARRLRYTIEMSQDLFPALCDSSLTQSLSNIQDILGRTKDSQSVLEFAKQSAATRPPDAVLVPLMKLVEIREDSTAKLGNAAILEALEVCDQVKEQFRIYFPDESAAL